MNDYARPEVLNGYSLRLPTPCGKFHLTLNDDGDNLREIRCTMGKSGTCQNILFQTIALFISVMLQSDISREKIKKMLLNQFEGNCGQRIYYKGDQFNSCVDFMITKILEDLGGRGEVEIEEKETT